MNSTSDSFQHLLRANGRSKVRVCRELLEDLDPVRPPNNCRPREFLWQYRALCERVAVYEQQLKDSNASVDSAGGSLQRAELALNHSLHYFEMVLTPGRAEHDEDDDF